MTPTPSRSSVRPGPLDTHPTVRALRERTPTPEPVPEPLDPGWLRALCLEAGADDVGFVSLDRPELDDERNDLRTLFPRTRTLISLVFRLHRENLQSTARSLANHEFHSLDDHIAETSRRIVQRLEARGVRGVHPPMGFPLEAERFPGKIWLVSHKRVAEAAGLGRMGIHRNLIHPRFGNFVLLGTVLIDRVVGEESRPIDFDPCLECKLCVAACPVGAVGSDGHFDFSACYTHNYREFMGGFQDYVEAAVDAKDRHAHREAVPPTESVSMWQSLSFGAQYKAAYCMAVCPAGEDVIQPFLEDRAGFQRAVVEPLREHAEPVYVLPDSDAAVYVQRRFPHKSPRFVGNTLKPADIPGFLFGVTLTFQRQRAGDLDATYHFVFTGESEQEATIVVRDRTVRVHEGLLGVPNLRITADARSWLRFLDRRSRLAGLLLTRRIRLKGSPKWLVAFGRCFPE